MGCPGGRAGRALRARTAARATRTPQNITSTPASSSTGPKKRNASGSISQSLCTRPTTHGVALRLTAARSAFMNESWFARNAADCECAYASAEKTIKCVRPCVKE